MILSFSGKKEDCIWHSSISNHHIILLYVSSINQGVHYLQFYSYHVYILWSISVGKIYTLKLTVKYFQIPQKTPRSCQTFGYLLVLLVRLQHQSSRLDGVYVFIYLQAAYIYVCVYVCAYVGTYLYICMPLIIFPSSK